MGLEALEWHSEPRQVPPCQRDRCSPKAKAVDSVSQVCAERTTTTMFASSFPKFPSPPERSSSVLGGAIADAACRLRLSACAAEARPVMLTIPRTEDGLSPVARLVNRRLRAEAAQDTVAAWRSAGCLGEHISSWSPPRALARCADFPIDIRLCCGSFLPRSASHSAGPSI